jgi:hypothetical protein
MSILNADNDRRFILPDEAPYLANLAALWSVDPALAAAIEAVDDAACYSIEPARSGDPTVAVGTAAGKKLYLHSRYQPLDEARRLVDAADFSRSFFYYLHGFGLGYVAQLAFDRAQRDAVLVVFEPDLAMLKTAFFARDCSAMLRSRRVMFFTRADKGELFTRLQPHIAMLTDGSVSIEHAPSLQLHGEFHQTMKTWAEEFNSYTATNITTLVINGRRTAENIARNLGWYAATPDLSHLRDRHAGLPAIVVSAGPSLRKNKHLLREAQGKAIIIAVQTTLKPLLEMGVEPHYVTSLDYHDICTRFFEKLPRSLRTHLVAEPKASPAIFGMYPGPISVLGNDFAEKLAREARLGRACLAAGATVAHLAFYLAEYLGCDPILFVGQDLGFSDGLCYAPGTSYEDVWAPELSRFCSVEMKQWEQIVRDRQILRRIPDYQGRPMYTEQRLYTYLQQFERDFSRTRRRVIDCTEGGARKRGAPSVPLRDALAQLTADGKKRTDPFSLLPETGTDPVLDWGRLGGVIQCLHLRLAESRQIEDIARKTLPLLEEVRDHLADQKRVNRAIARIDALRSRMNELGPCYDLVTQLTQKTEIERFRRDRALESEPVEGLERQRRQVQRDIDNVRSIIHAADEFQDLMTDVIDRLENQLATHTGRRQARLKGAA